MNNNNRIKLSILFLNFNRLEDTRNTVTHLKQIIKDRDDIEVIAVDNNSTDGTTEILKTHSNWLTLIALGENTGIGGLNKGFVQATGDYILVLDDDSHPYDENTLDILIECFDNRSDVGVVACRIEFPNGDPHWTWHLPRNMDVPSNSMAFVGCGFAIRRELFKKVGWYPERFFLYQNEIDVAIRVLKEGYQIYYEPRCRVVHHESPVGRSSWRQVYFPTRNTIWIIRKYFPFIDSVYLIFSRLCMGLIRAIQYREYGWYVKAVIDAFTEPIESEKLSSSMLLKLRKLWRQNSVYHQFKNRLSSWRRPWTISSLIR